MVTSTVVRSFRVSLISPANTNALFHMKFWIAKINFSHTKYHNPVLPSVPTTQRQLGGRISQLHNPKSANTQVSVPTHPVCQGGSLKTRCICPTIPVVLQDAILTRICYLHSKSKSPKIYLTIINHNHMTGLSIL